MPSPPNPLGLHGWRMLWDNITSEGNVTECRCLKSCKPILPKFLLANWCVKWPGWQKQDAHARRSGLHHLARHVITTARNLKSTVGLWMGHGSHSFQQDNSRFVRTPLKTNISLWKFDGWFRWIPRFGGQKRPVFRGKLGKLAVKLQGCNPEQDSERHGSRNGSGKDFVLPKKWDHRVIECSAAFR